jgi:hypothetical protein
MEDNELSNAVPADNPSPNFDFLIFSVPKPVAQRALNCGKTKLHDLLGLGLLDAVKNGPRTEITVESIRRYQASMPRATFKLPNPPRLEDLDRLHRKQRQLAAQRRAKRCREPPFQGAGVSGPAQSTEAHVRSDGT